MRTSLSQSKEAMIAEGGFAMPDGHVVFPFLTASLAERAKESLAKEGTGGNRFQYYAPGRF